MNEDKNELTRAELTDEELTEVVGGNTNWDAVLYQMSKLQFTYPETKEVIAAIKTENWIEATVLILRFLSQHPELKTDIVKYM